MDLRALLDPFANAVCIDCGEHADIDRLARIGASPSFAKKCPCDPYVQRIDIPDVTLRAQPGPFANYLLMQLRISLSGTEIVSPPECRHCGAPDNGKPACRYCGTMRQAQQPCASGNIRFAVNGTLNPDQQIARAVAARLRASLPAPCAPPGVSRETRAAFGVWEPVQPPDHW